MKNNAIAIIEIGSNNTKTHIYENESVIYEANSTIELKKNYSMNSAIDNNDLEKLCVEIEKALTFTNNVHIFGCSIFRKMSDPEMDTINSILEQKYHLKISVVSQEDEALLTAYGCYSDVDYDENICVFIGGGGSVELIVVKNKKIIENKYFDFGVVDITKKFETLKSDSANSNFEEVYSYVDHLIDDINFRCDVLILAGGDHLYWYNNAKYPLSDNTLYKNEKQRFILDIESSDKYDKDAFVTSLDKIRANSDNPVWFDGARAMKVITNVISHKINAKYIIPTKINMEDGLIQKIMNSSK